MGRISQQIPLFLPFLAMMTLGLLFWSGEASGEEISGEYSRGEIALHEEAPLERVEELIARARDEAWGTRELFSFLELDQLEGCQGFSNRAYLKERHARWAEAVVLLGEINEEALFRWLLGLSAPPAAATAEVEHQLRCMIEHLIMASRLEEYQVRLFPSISGVFGGAIRNVSELADRVEANPRWVDRTVSALNRSFYRDLGTQGFIWYRKFVFEGRSFNLVSQTAAERCRMAAGQTWKPDAPGHQRCWRERLSPGEREEEILIASAAPGLSRHHWGTDVDILGLNPRLFVEGGVLYEDWRWLDNHGLDHGFFQPYRGSPEMSPAHFEERWHWSYFPIAQALWEYILENQEKFEEALFAQWDRLERRWGARRGPFFGYMRENWRAYLFHIDVPRVEMPRSVKAGEWPLP